MTSNIWGMIDLTLVIVLWTCALPDIEIRMHTVMLSLMLKTSDFWAESVKKSWNTSLLRGLTCSSLKSCSFIGHGPENRSFPSSSCQSCVYRAPWQGGCKHWNWDAVRGLGGDDCILSATVWAAKRVRQMPRFLLKASRENQQFWNHIRTKTSERLLKLE